jgi:hypothetical protein
VSKYHATGLYGFGDEFAVEAHFNATDFLAPNFDIKEDFIGDNGACCRSYDIGEKRECHEEEPGYTGTEHTERTTVIPDVDCGAPASGCVFSNF